VNEIDLCYLFNLIDNQSKNLIKLSNYFIFENETNITVIERHRITNYQLTNEYIYTQPKQEETKANI